MTRTLPDVSNSRGAPMGRVSRTLTPEDTSEPRKFSLRVVLLDRGGYDSGGAYWGLGEPVYWACSEDYEAEFFFRARDREAAKAEVLRRYPNARFFR